MNLKRLVGDAVLFLFIGLLLLTAALAIFPGLEVAWKGIVDGKAKWLLDLFTAVGTCGAVAAALFLGVDSRRAAAREKLAVAKLTASEISVRLDSMAHRLAKIYEAWVGTLEAGLDHGNVVRDFHFLEEFVADDALYFKRETLVDLIPLPNQAAHRLARAMDYMRLMRRDCSKVAGDIRGFSPPMALRWRARLFEALEGAINQLQIVAATCKAAAELDQSPELPE